MSRDEIQDMAEILKGYENWRRAKVDHYDSEPFSVSDYLDEIAKQRAVDAIAEIQQVYDDPELTWQEVDAEIRRILGIRNSERKDHSA
jgi:hypothetical protein